MNGRMDREMDGTRMVSGEARTRRQIEGFWRVSAVSRVANRREVSFFVGSSGRRALQRGGRERPVLCCKCRG